jgi:hypothetical protein
MKLITLLILASFSFTTLAKSPNDFTRYDEAKIKSMVNDIESTLSDTIGESSMIDSLGETQSWGIETDNKDNVVEITFYINYTKLNGKKGLMRCDFPKSEDFTTDHCFDSSSNEKL